MRTYVYTDGFCRKTDLIKPEELKADENEHGLLLYMNNGKGAIIRCDKGYEEKLQLANRDQERLAEFADSQEPYFSLEYRDATTCRRRSMCLKNWINQNGYGNRIRMYQRKETLFFEKERICQQTTT